MFVRIDQPWANETIRRVDELSLQLELRERFEVTAPIL